MFGSSHSYASRGIIPRFISDLFALLEKQTELEASVFVSFCEIDSELLFDLLADGGLDGQTGTELQVSQSQNTISESTAQVFEAVVKCARCSKVGRILSGTCYQMG